MRVALLWPDYWPYIRRGTERMVHDIATQLASQGHEIDIIASKPGSARVRKDGPITVYYLAQWTHPLLKSMRLVPRFDTHGLQSLRVLLRKRYDLIHCFFYSFAPAVRMVRRLRGTPYIYHVVSIPPDWRRAADSWMLRRALSKAAAVRVFSQWCADYMRENHSVEPFILAPTVDPHLFRPEAGQRDPKVPKILFTADLADQRKGGRLLIQAFNRVHRALPDARLQLAGPIGFGLQEALRPLSPEARSKVDVLGTGRLESLPALYASAAVTVLPSRGEPFGMVLTESLASGTPVVGARSGAIPEIVDDPSIGTLFDLDPEDEPGPSDRLAEAILRSCEISQQDGIAARCRSHASSWTWETQAGLLDRLHEISLRPGTRDRMSEASARAA